MEKQNFNTSAQNTNNISGLSIAGFCFGLAALVFYCILVFFVGFIAFISFFFILSSLVFIISITGLILAIVGQAKKKSGLGVAAISVSAVSFGIIFLTYLFWIFLVVIV